jgi:hypothetical protein
MEKLEEVRLRVAIGLRGLTRQEDYLSKWARMLKLRGVQLVDKSGLLLGGETGE